MFRLLLGLTLSTMLACTSDMTEMPAACVGTPTFDSGIRDIIRSKCATSGCHDGSASVGNYRSYQGMQGILNNQGFRQQVIVTMAMPLTGMLTATEFDRLRCWSENGYPEK